MQIVVIRPGALGDTLLTLPALALLHRRWPDSRLMFVGRRDALPLVAASGLVDATSPYDLPGWSALFGDDTSHAGRAAEMLHGCDVAVAWLTDPEGVVVRNLRARGISQVVVAPGRPAPTRDEHAAIYLARTLVPFGIAPRRNLDALRQLVPLRSFGTAERLAGADVARVASGAARRPVVALHPGSGGAAKRWPPERFAAIAARLAAAGYQPLLIQGPQDEPVVKQTLDALDALDAFGALGAFGAFAPNAVRPAVAAGLSPVRLAALLTGCAGFLGNDSGVSHLAGLLALPTLALFGPTDPAVWSPLGPHVRTLRDASATMAGLDVETVWAALPPLLPDAEG